MASFTKLFDRAQKLKHNVKEMKRPFNIIRDVVMAVSLGEDAQVKVLQEVQEAATLLWTVTEDMKRVTMGLKPNYTEWTPEDTDEEEGAE